MNVPMIEVNSSLISTGSIDSSISSSAKEYTPQILGYERIIALMSKQINDLTERLSKVEINKMAEEYQIPPEIVGQAQQYSTWNPVRNRKYFRKPLKSEIEEIIKKAHPTVLTYREIARKFGVHTYTLRKLMTLYGIEKPKVKSIKLRTINPYRGTTSIDKILAGKCPNIKLYKIRKKLLRSGLKANQCEICGYSKKREDDGERPLILLFFDGNKSNYNIENLRYYCYNCLFVHSIQQAPDARKKFLDPTWITNKF